MHYFVIVFTDEAPDAGALEKALAPHYEDQWDWWQKGGRYTGRLDGYEPHEDDSLLRTCDVCGGTGERPGGLKEFGEAWYNGCNGCNGCKGTGKSRLWPTQWPDRQEDTQLVRDVDWSSEDKQPYAFVAQDVGWVSQKDWNGSTFEDNPRHAELWSKALTSQIYATVVDCHN